MQDPVPSKQEQEAAVRRFWNERHQDPRADAHDNYLSHPFVQAYVSMRAFGSAIGHLDAAIHAIDGRTKPGDRILSLGCGPAEKEMALAGRLPGRTVVGIDVAEEIVELATQKAAQAGLSNLEIQIGDFNQLDLAQDSYQMILGLGALHHVENLEGFWEQARRALRPDGVVMAQEYIGPSRFQWTDAQIAEGTRCLREIVPEEHKVHHSEMYRISVADMLRIDPSEAVRSAEILSTARQAGFDVSGYASAGGSLLQPVLMHQIYTFDPGDWSHNLVLAKLFAEEDRLMREGVLQDDFAMFVAAPS